jgi:methionyl-tRNA synthetase
VPATPAATGLEDDFAGINAAIAKRFDDLEVSAALEDVWVLVRRLNRFVEEQAPWKLAKDDGNAAALDKTLYGLIEGLRVVSIMLNPYIPQSTAKLMTALGCESELGDFARAEFGAGAGGHTVGELPQLFPKLETASA